MSWPPLPTWEKLAADRYLYWCRGILPNGQMCFENHDRGALSDEPRTGTVHWRDRRSTRQGIARFLYLIAFAELATDEPLWRRRYRALRRAIRYSQQAGLRLPTHVWNADKIRLKTMLLKVPTTDVEREEAMKWLLQ